jgi:hypothetical protein
MQMKWEKLGCIWKASDFLSWGSMGTLTPTPLKLKGDLIRVYCGIRDSGGVARIGYFDVKESAPWEIVGHCDAPVLDVGLPGAFDDNGMLLGDLIEVDGEIRMYYVGFQLATKVKFLAYGGLAISSDGGDTFSRYSNAPVIERDDPGLYIRAIHGISKLANGKYRAWYSEGNSWEMINGNPYPRYSIAVVDSPDGLQFEKNAGRPIDIALQGEYRIGRSRVFSLTDNDHLLTFTYGKANGEYRSGCARSADLINWKRSEEWNLSPGPGAFDSEHLAYPAMIKTSSNEIYCFYNGNDMGAGGIGLAKLIRP